MNKTFITKFIKIMQKQILHDVIIYYVWRKNSILISSNKKNCNEKNALISWKFEPFVSTALQLMQQHVEWFINFINLLFLFVLHIAQVINFTVQLFILKLSIPILHLSVWISEFCILCKKKKNSFSITFKITYAEKFLRIDLLLIS